MSQQEVTEAILRIYSSNLSPHHSEPWPSSPQTIRLIFLWSWWYISALHNCSCLDLNHPGFHLTLNLSGFQDQLQHV